MSVAQSNTPVFVRDSYTWLLYVLLGIYAFYLTMLGPTATFLKDELNLSYTVAGMHSSAFALGMITIAAGVEWLLIRWGRMQIFWGSGIGLVLASVLFILAQNAVLTITAAYLMGCSGTAMLTLIQSALVHYHGVKGTIALIEANIVASFFSGVGALLLGGMERTILGWRSAVIFFGLLFLVLFARNYRMQHRVTAEHPSETHTPTRSGKLPMIFWILWLIAFMGVCLEWSMGYWGAEYLVQEGGLSKSLAATLMSLFFLSAVIGRWVSSRLAVSIEVYRLLVGALAIVLVGFVLYWLAPAAPLMVAGLVIGGLGTSNLWPLGLGAALSSVAPHHTQFASGRMAIASGSAILLAPQLLGIAADIFSLKGAYAFVIVLALVATALAVWAQRRIQSSREG